jgi:hypothetical protein
MPTVYYTGLHEGLYLPLIEHYVGPCNYAGPHDSLMQQSVVSLVGQCQLIVQTSYSYNGPTRGLCLPLTEHHASEKPQVVY